MTVDQLNKANEIQKEIEQLSQVYLMLDLTIEKEEEAYNPIRRFIRFLNCSLKRGEERQAHAILFEDGILIGQDIPVDLDFLKYLRSYFKDRLDDKTEELGEI